MNDASAMGVVQGVENPDDDVDLPVGGREAGRPLQRLEARSLEVLHHDVDAPLRLQHVVDGNDARMRQPRAGARLAQEPLDRQRVGVARGQGLDGDGALQHRVVRLVDVAHAAASEPALDAEAIVEVAGKIVGR